MELRKISKDKKGMTIGDLYPVILIIAVAGILIAVVMTIMEEWKGVTNNEVGTTYNETVTSAELTTGADSVSLDNKTTCGADTFLIVFVTNVTDESVPNTANYTLSTDGVFTNLTDENGIEGYNVSYTFNYGGDDCEAIDDIITDFVDFIPWIGIILLVIAAAIVLGVVISSFRKPKI